LPVSKVNEASITITYLPPESDNIKSFEDLITTQSYDAQNLRHSTDYIHNDTEHLNSIRKDTLRIGRAEEISPYQNKENAHQLHESTKVIDITNQRLSQRDIALPVVSTNVRKINEYEAVGKDTQDLLL
jgi:hypothetical protein